ncbi:MAG: hypothetical protein JNK73_05795 [Bacteroidia bacterium]|nr:hypothetical protein [Bacteroidia bacterium]
MLPDGLMKYLAFILLTCHLASGQVDQKLVDSIKFVSDVPYICRSQTLEQIRQSPVPTIGCGDILFWRLVQQRQVIIPQLIEKLTDTTQTDISVPYVGGQYSVADIAYSVLEEIIKDIPTFKLLGVNPKKYSSPSYAFWTTVRSRRREFKSAVTKWYKDNKDNLMWVDSDETLSGDSALRHPSGGHFVVKR